MRAKLFLADDVKGLLSLGLIPRPSVGKSFAVTEITFFMRWESNPAYKAGFLFQ